MNDPLFLGENLVVHYTSIYDDIFPQQKKNL